MADVLRATIFVRLFNVEHLLVNYDTCVACSSNGFQSCTKHSKSVLFSQEDQNAGILAALPYGVPKSVSAKDNFGYFQSLQ